MPVIRCETPGCGYMAAVPAWQVDEVLEAHVATHRERASPCTCIEAAFDPFCPVHAREAVR